MYGLIAYVDERDKLLYNSNYNRTKKYNGFANHREIKYKVRFSATEKHR